MRLLNEDPAQSARRVANVVLLTVFLLPALAACSVEGPGDDVEPVVADRAASPFQRRVDPSGCVAEQVTSANHHEGQVQGASADGRLLALSVRREGADEDQMPFDIYEMDLATGASTRLPQTLENSGPYSPDNRFIVTAQTAEDGKTDIYEYERSTGELTAVVPHEQWDWLPSYSPDGRFIVFNSYRVGGQADIHLFEKATGTLTRLTDDPGYDSNAQFASDGKRIVYNNQRGTREEGGYIFDLMVYDTDTGDTTRLTNGDYEESYPAWAPDGRHIVFSSDADGEHGKLNLYVLDTVDETTTRVTKGDWKDSYAFWSRDGKYIYFSSDRDGATNIYRLVMDGADCLREIS